MLKAGVRDVDGPCVVRDDGQVECFIDYRQRDWSAALERLLSQAPPPEKPALNGAEIAADEILDLVTKNAKRNTKSE